ncbi:unnamed protein product [Urochloa decumbens]|uniref:Protein kinase domain-containing protein n=1 Tax=Urochloa decumbens TaxID=240449 RepID=A0ABC9H6R8_9POAL
MDSCTRSRDSMENEESTKMSYELLQSITDNFSEKRLLGSGTFGMVYKGTYTNGKEIAVKVLRDMAALDDKDFKNEFQNLAKLDHQNIVQLVGYCNESEDHVVEQDGRQFTAQKLHKALCFEYVDNGSLNKYISDETQGLQWHIRYKIIKGICDGLKHLHKGLETPVLHLDLKPHNILLDKEMVPKIADFGLSRIIGDERTRQTLKNDLGTGGYLPPEYTKFQLLSPAFDIFSLGIIITKIMVGKERYNDIADMQPRKLVKLVHNNWKKRLQEIVRPRSLEVYCQQVKTCIEVASKCLTEDRHGRPKIQEIINILNETEMVNIPLEIEEIHEFRTSIPSVQTSDRWILAPGVETAWKMRSPQKCHTNYCNQLQITSQRNDFSVVAHLEWFTRKTITYRCKCFSFYVEQQLKIGIESTQGTYTNGKEIAVKVLRDMAALDDKDFKNEFQNLAKLDHQNIVQLVGYCNESEDHVVEQDGRQFTAQKLHKALCFEYVDNGSLNKYISDETQGLQWHIRYKIIKGICDGLKHLHKGLETPVLHLDLKPHNILLDKEMVPKIADFGLSRIIGDERTRQTLKNDLGTGGYLPPEYTKFQLLSPAFDIFSLGIIITKIMVGKERYNDIADMQPRKLVKLVHNNWKKRLQEIVRPRSLEVYCQQVKTCIEVASKCLTEDRHGRPKIQEIINILNETEMVNIPLEIEEIHEFRTSIPSVQTSGTSMDSCTRSRDSMENEESTKMSYELLQSITDNFSEKRLLGSGTFGMVYKGTYTNGKEIAVKVLRDMAALDDKDFKNEFQNLAKLDHQNIVQLVGYCNESEDHVVEQDGRQFTAQKLHKALCFEYVDNGSLNKYISGD